MAANAERIVFSPTEIEMSVYHIPISEIAGRIL